MSLPSQTESGDAPGPGSTDDEVAERDDVRRAVRDLDADGLLARDRREDADLGGRQRVREIVAQAGDAGDLRARGELELVARHARAGDGADEAGLDAVLGERAEQRARDPLGVRIAADRGRALAQHARVGQAGTAARRRARASTIDLRQLERVGRLGRRAADRGRTAAAGRRAARRSSSEVVGDRRRLVAASVRTRLGSAPHRRARALQRRPGRAGRREAVAPGSTRRWRARPRRPSARRGAPRGRCPRAAPRRRRRSGAGRRRR